MGPRKLTPGYYKHTSPTNQVFYFYLESADEQQNSASFICQMSDWVGEDLQLGKEIGFINNIRLIRIGYTAFTTLEESNEDEFNKGLLSELIRTVRTEMIGNPRNDSFRIYYKNTAARTQTLMALLDLIKYYERRE